MQVTQQQNDDDNQKHEAEQRRSSAMHPESAEEAKCFVEAVNVKVMAAFVVTVQFKRIGMSYG